MSEAVTVWQPPTTPTAPAPALAQPLVYPDCAGATPETPVRVWPVEAAPIPDFSDWAEKPSLTMAYADPPYIGQAKRHYGDDPNCAEVDHEELIDRLCREYPFGWALSCSSPSLRTILPLCPEDVRVGAWVKPFCSFKPNVNPAYAWEPVIFHGGRTKGREVPTVRDWVAENITLQKGCAGAKPGAFCVWMFEMLGLRSGDTLVDLYPGSGAVTRAWKQWSGRAIESLCGQPELGIER